MKNGHRWACAYHSKRAKGVLEGVLYELPTSLHKECCNLGLSPTCEPMGFPEGEFKDGVGSWLSLNVRAENIVCQVFIA